MRSARMQHGKSVILSLSVCLVSHFKMRNSGKFVIKLTVIGICYHDRHVLSGQNPTTMKLL